MCKALIDQSKLNNIKQRLKFFKTLIENPRRRIDGKEELERERGRERDIELEIF